LISLDGGFVDLIGFGNKALEEGFLVLEPTFNFFHNSLMDICNKNGRSRPMIKSSAKI
jgi:hypothetical protein